MPSSFASRPTPCRPGWTTRSASTRPSTTVIVSTWTRAGAWRRTRRIPCHETPVAGRAGGGGDVAAGGGDPRGVRALPARAGRVDGPAALQPDRHPVHDVGPQLVAVPRRVPQRRVPALARRDGQVRPPH